MESENDMFVSIWEARADSIRYFMSNRLAMVVVKDDGGQWMR
jgi:hypothetical protein